ncbi:MAG: hypothetical protein IJY12_02045 [Clostridia bacterium]|nr:hypothetical protein [Clostridia bacterium]
MKFKIGILAFLLSVLSVLTAAQAEAPSVMASVSLYEDIDLLESAPKIAEIQLVNERIATHQWEFTLSDDEVLTCVGTQVREQGTEFAFSGLKAGVCDVVFEYKKRYDASEAVLITEVYRFYVDPQLGVTYEHIHFNTNER